MNGLQTSIPLSYVLVGFNSRRFVQACVDSILADAPAGAEIVFIDNASSDGTAELLAARFPDVHLVINAENIGHCRAVNQGMKLARGRFIMVMDVDTEVVPGASAQLLQFLQSNPRVACVAPRMLEEDGTIQETARNFPRPLNGLFGRQTALSRWFPNNPFTRGYLAKQNLNQDEPFEVEWVSAACMVFPRETIDKAGYWDEGYAGYWVDCDWCKRIELSGGQVYCVPGAQVRHFEHNRPGRVRSASRLKMFNDGAYRFFMLHHTWGTLDPRALAARGALGLRTFAQSAYSRKMSRRLADQNVIGDPIDHVVKQSRPDVAAAKD